MEKNNDNIYLTKDEISSVLDTEIGRGTDGRVFKYDRNRLLKLYHKYLNRLTNRKVEEPDDDVKIYNMGDRKDKSDFYDMFTFYKTEDDGNFIRIRNGEAAIHAAQERQLKVKHTRLPKNAVFIDGKFAGCTLLKVRGIQIHKMIGLPFSLKKKIMKKVLRNVKELMDNYIYHLDLANSPYSRSLLMDQNGKIENVGHSHVLINPITLQPRLIDLDGKSTVYTDYYSEDLEKKTLASFNELMLEFLLSIDLDQYESDDEISYELSQIGIDIEYIDLLINNAMTYEQLDEFIDNVEIKRK